MKALVIIMCAVALAASAEPDAGDFLVPSLAGYEFGKSYDLARTTNCGTCHYSTSENGTYLLLSQTSKGRLYDVEVRKTIKLVPASEKARYDDLVSQKAKSEVAAIESMYGIKLCQDKPLYWFFTNGKSRIEVYGSSGTDIHLEDGRPGRAYVVRIRAERMDILDAD